MSELAKMLADQVAKNPQKWRDELAKYTSGTQAKVNRNMYLVPRNDLNVAGWTDTRSGDVYVTPFGNVPSTIGHEGFHQMYSGTPGKLMPMPDSGTKERGMLVNELRTAYKKIKDAGVIDNFAVNMKDSGDELMAELVGLEAAQAPGVDLDQTDIGKLVLGDESQPMNKIYRYYKTGANAGPMEPPGQAIKRFYAPPPAAKQPAEGQSVVGKLLWMFK